MNSAKIKSTLFENKTTLLFVILCIGGIIAADQPLSFVVNELVTRFGRNTFLVLALLIPITAGMGLNFAIVIGALAAQISVFFVTYWEITGIGGFLLAAVMSVPMAILFGYLTGNLFNRIKGSEMIGGIILGYFADGVYQLLFLFIIGGVIPMYSIKLIMSNGIGVKNTIDLTDGLKYALDDLVKIGLLDAFLITAVLFILYKVYKLVRYHRHDLKSKQALRHIAHILIMVAAYGLTFVPYVEAAFATTNLPVITYVVIALLCAFNQKFMKTVIGQKMRTVGQDMDKATAAGINVDKTRILAIIISTVLASWGQLILLQNMGVFQTYGAHTQVGQYAIASLLVGGASVHKANSKQAVLGVILFHTLFVVSPVAGKNLFDSAQLGEYFRVFVSYGVIALSLALHAWNKPKRKTAVKAISA